MRMPVFPEGGFPPGRMRAAKRNPPFPEAAERCGRSGEDGYFGESTVLSVKRALSLE